MFIKSKFFIPRSVYPSKLYKYQPHPNYYLKRVESIPTLSSGRNSLFGHDSLFGSVKFRSLNSPSFNKNLNNGLNNNNNLINKDLNNTLSNSLRNNPNNHNNNNGVKRGISQEGINSTKPIVGYWLLGTSGLVFGIVVMGGLTRLTESGLSIVEWKPVTGIIPPMTNSQWEEEFEKYKQFPEYKL